MGLDHDVCGCYGDSGPYTVYCERHDPDNLTREIPRLLAEIERLREVASERVEDAAHL